MKLRTQILSFVCLSALLMTGVGLAENVARAGEGKTLVAEDLRTRLVDHTYFSSGGEGDNKWKSFFYFQPDGTVLAKSWGKSWRVSVKGTWEISGDLMCSKYENKDWGEGCYEYSEKGDDKLLSTGVSGTNKGKKYVVKLIGKGNVKNLE